MRHPFSWWAASWTKQRVARSPKILANNWPRNGPVHGSKHPQKTIRTSGKLSKNSSNSIERDNSISTLIRMVTCSTRAMDHRRLRLPHHMVVNDPHRIRILPPPPTAAVVRIWRTRMSALLFSLDPPLLSYRAARTVEHRSCLHPARRPVMWKKAPERRLINPIKQ